MARRNTRASSAASDATAERSRLAEDDARRANWKRWGPYLSERQWGTVREDYSPDGAAWDYFPHEHARSRAYRWGEDGLLGITDRQCRLCFSLALWNEKDPILKERLFGLTNPQGNHGEDVKETYFYVDSTPTHSYMKALYRYPHARFPYERLVEENARRGRAHDEFEIEDAGVFDEHRFFDVVVEYAKAAQSDLLIRVTATNHGPDAAPLHLLPTLWFRNTWSWGRLEEGSDPAAVIARRADGVLVASHRELGEHLLAVDGSPEILYTNNDTNAPKLFGAKTSARWFKDAFHERVVAGREEAVRPDGRGTKAAPWFRFDVPAGASVEIRLRLVESSTAPRAFFGDAFDETFAARIREAEGFYASIIPANATPEERNVARQAYAGLLWSKQFYQYSVHDWLEGDPAQPTPPAARLDGRNADWPHLYNHDVLSMPDKWEYPWYAAWDLAFHALPLSRVDAGFAKQQLLLLLREWYMHPSGQIPAYEWAFGDVNPPVHAWAAWRVYIETGPPGARDLAFLEKAFQKLLVNFTWWVNRKDVDGNHVFAGGFLGLDNIGVFDRSRPLPSGGQLEQADGTAWMGFYASSMLSIALELARHNSVYEDIASKFFEHFIAIADAMNSLGGTGLWDEEDGFYYDRFLVDGRVVPLRVRSMVGLVPLLAVEVSEAADFASLPEYVKRAQWFVKNRRDLRNQISHLDKSPDGKYWLLAMPSRDRLVRVLRRMLDEREFLSPFGIRSVSRVHAEEPFVLRVGDEEFRLAYEPGESRTSAFGGNSNWRGPIWFPLNYLMIQALRRLGRFYGDGLRVECPTGSGRLANLDQVADEVERRLASLFLADERGRRACGECAPRAEDLVLFHEYFDGDSGRGLGASHQTGWTALVVRCIESIARERTRKDR
jgi:hypothetical protein